MISWLENLFHLTWLLQIKQYNRYNWGAKALVKYNKPPHKIKNHSENKKKKKKTSFSIFKHTCVKELFFINYIIC